ncbi:MAG: RES family NAD+ phosphorylase [Bacteroidota bacterium]
MIVYRIGSCPYIDDLSGKGAALYGGRWNSKDTYMLYVAQSSALALLETVVHIGKIPPVGFCMATIEVPDNSVAVYPAETLPDNWYGSPPPDYLKAIGDRFITEGRHLALKVPSVVMTEEYNYLINPAHKDFVKVKIVARRAVRLDERLFSKS